MVNRQMREIKVKFSYFGLSTINYELSTMNHELSTINYMNVILKIGQK